MHDYVLLNKRSAVQRSQVPCESQLGSDVKTSGGKTENSKGGEAGRLRRLQGPGPCAWALASRSPNGTVCLSLGPMGSGWPVGRGQRCGADAAG